MKGFDMNVARMGVQVAGAVGRARRRWPRFASDKRVAEAILRKQVSRFIEAVDDDRRRPGEAERSLYDAVAVMVRIAMNDGGCLDRPVRESLLSRLRILFRRMKCRCALAKE